jgi:alpha-N-acetylglucosaminidase
MKKYLFFVFLFIIFSLCTNQEQAFEPIVQLAKRRVPWLAPHISFSVLKDNGRDIFELSTEGNTLNIAASNANAAAMGLNWYLKYYCKRSMSHLGDNLKQEIPFPKIKDKVRIEASLPIRYALNYCTMNYSMSFYTWEDWERELDWMALNGVNLMLSTIGLEAVWQNTLRKLNFADEEIFDFISGPAFTAWWLMGNLEGWGGPVTQQMIDRQTVLQKKILRRMKELKIQPVMQGFYGVVPKALKNKFKVNIIEQGEWAGGFQRPDFLLPTDEEFDRIGGIYYSEMKELYGSDFHFFGGDPFHEGGSTKGVDVTASSSNIQKTMQKHFPSSTWVLQGWGNNPTKKLLDGLNKSNILIIELFGENTNNWEKRQGYENTPFIWSNVSNFGEKNGLYGRLERFNDEVFRAKKSVYGPLLKGVGIIPEGINNNPVTYDFMLELGWHENKVDVSKWIENYTQYRYGVQNDTIIKAWQLLLETVYSSPNVYQEGPSESIFCARPDTNVKAVSTWGTRKRNYSIEKLNEAVSLLTSVSGEIRKTETYIVDRTDFVRQCLANKADSVYALMVDALSKNNIDQFQESAKQFKVLLLKQDSLLNSNKFFRLHTWLKKATDFGENDFERSIALKNAKIQISYWGPDYNPKTSLHDYAHKEWGGLLSSLYLERWNSFIKSKIERINGQTPDVDYFEIEKKWTESKEIYDEKSLSQTEVDLLIQRILKN